MTEPGTWLPSSIALVLDSIAVFNRKQVYWNFYMPFFFFVCFLFGDKVSSSIEWPWTPKPLASAGGALDCKCATSHIVYAGWDWSQGFVCARQAPYQLSYISIPCLLPKHLCFVPDDIASFQRCLSKYVLGTGRRHEDISDEKDVWSKESRGEIRSVKFIRKSHDSPLHIWSYTEDTVFLLRVLFCGCFHFLLG